MYHKRVFISGSIKDNIGYGKNDLVWKKSLNSKISMSENFINEKTDTYDSR